MEEGDDFELHEDDYAYEEEDDGEEPLDIDENLTPLERTAFCLRSATPFRRQWACTQLRHVWHVHAATSRDAVLNLLQVASRTADSACRSTTACELSEIVCSVPETALETSKYLLPLLVDLLRDSYEAVRTATCDALGRVASVLPTSWASQMIVAQLLPLSTAPSADVRTTAAMLTSRIAQSMQATECADACSAALATLSSDAVHHVRRAAGEALGVVLGSLGTACVGLLDLIPQLASDDSWSVRASAIDALSAAASAATEPQQMEMLVSEYQKACNDSTRWVRLAAARRLGRFLVALGPLRANVEMVRQFTQQASASGPDAELGEHCAFTFPGVVLTVGRQRWSELSVAFQALCQDMRWVVRRPIACALHEISRVIGPELSEKHLLNPFTLFMNDVDEVKTGFLKHLAELLECFNSGTRETCLPVILDIMQSSVPQWRPRKILAKQLVRLAQFYRDGSIEQLAAQLSVDSVSTVRNAAHQSVALLLQDPRVRELLLPRLAALAVSPSCFHRIAFAHICAAAATANHAVTSHFAQTCALLSVDSVANVRIAAARALRIINAGYESDTPAPGAGGVQAALEALSHDIDNDVVYQASGIQRPFKPRTAKTSSAPIVQDAEIVIPDVAQLSLQDSGVEVVATEVPSITQPPPGAEEELTTAENTAERV